jgi:hypothetical protein
MTRLPDQKLVYLHCWSIFNGSNAQIRRQKKIVQVLAQHKKSIKTLTNAYPLDAIAIVAKKLLDERVFEITTRAQRRFPDLFQPSQTQEAEREASEAEVARIEAAIVHETVGNSDEEWEEEAYDLNPSQDQGLLPDARPGTVGLGDQNVTAEER